MTICWGSYLYRERERQREITIDIYIYIYIHTLYQFIRLWALYIRIHKILEIRGIAEGKNNTDLLTGDLYVYNAHPGTGIILTYRKSTQYTNTHNTGQRCEGLYQYFSHTYTPVFKKNVFFFVGVHAPLYQIYGKLQVLLIYVCALYPFDNIPPNKIKCKYILLANAICNKE